MEIWKFGKFEKFRNLEKNWEFGKNRYLEI